MSNKGTYKVKIFRCNFVRSFKGNFNVVSKELFEAELKQSVTKFRNYEKYSKTLGQNQLDENYYLMKKDINRVVKNIKKQISTII